MPFLTLPIAMLALTAASEPQQTTAAAETSAPTANVRVYVDPETGALSPTPVTAEQRNQAQREAQDAAAKSNQFPSKRMPDGSLMVEFGEDMMMNTVATVDADGKTHLNCTHAHDHATAHASDEAHNSGEHK